MEEKTKSVFNKEVCALAVSFMLIVLLLKIVFYQEGFFEVLKITVAIFWLLILPGYCIIVFWKNDFGFLERVIMSIPVSVAVLGISGYYLGLAGVNLKLLALILPSLIFVAVIVGKLFKSQR